MKKIIFLLSFIVCFSFMQSMQLNKPDHSAKSNYRYFCPACFSTGKGEYLFKKIGDHDFNHGKSSYVSTKPIDYAKKEMCECAVFVCEECPKRFHAPGRFLTHLLNRHSIRTYVNTAQYKKNISKLKYTCKLCCKEYWSKNSFEAHFLDHKKKVQNICKQKRTNKFCNSALAAICPPTRKQ